MIYLPPANEVCEGYVFTDVCLSTGGSTHTLSTRPPGMHAPQAHAPLHARPPPRDALIERAVRILLECILVW